MEIARNYSNFTTNGSPNFLGFAPLIQILNRITFLSFSVFSLFCLIYIKLNARSFMKCSRLCHNNIRGILCCILFIIHLCDFGNCILGDGSVLTCLTTVISWVSLQSLYGSLELKSNVKFFIGVISCFLFLCSVAKFLSALLLIKSPNFSINNVNFFVDVCISLLCFLLTILEALTYLTEVKQIRKEEVKEEFQCYLHNSSPWWSKLLFHWLTPLLIKGFREPLELENLGQLPEEECIHHQFKRFVHVYLSLKSSQKVNQFSLWHCYASVYHRCFIIGGVLKLLGDFAGLIGPLCISVIIKYIENLQEPNQRREVLKISSLTFKEFISNGYVMAVAVLLSAVAQGSFSQASTHILNIEGIRLKSALQALIYSKVLRSRKIVEDKSELVKNSLNVTKLVSEDCYNIMSCYWMGHYLWAIPVKISVLITLLYYEIGFSAIVGSFSCILIFTPLLFLIGKMMSSNSKLIMYWSDERMKQTNEVLQGIKLLKLYGWEDNFFYKILEVRDKELHLLNKDSLFWALMTFFTHSSSIFITFVTFGIYTLTETKPLSPSSVFSGLALFNQLTVPLFIFPIIVPIVISALNSTKRIEEFLSMPEVVSSHKKKTGELNSFLDPTMEALNFKQTKVLINTNSNEILANILEINEEGDVEDETFGDSKIENSLDSNVVEAESGKNLSGCEFSILQSKNGLNECSEQQMSYSKTDDSESFVQVQVEPSNGTRLKQSLKTVEKNYREELSVIKSTCDASCEGNNVVEVHDAVLSWGCSNRPQLRISKLFIPKGQLTMIIGNVGSGKTSLLAALLGEMECISGNIEWTAKTSLAYVPQKPWLLNATLRDNILFGRSYHAQRFNRAVAACTLQPDIDILPDKDLTLIGENGITLSGGQQQRITIARAIYSRAEVIILDDPLSALDHKVAKHVFDRGIKRLSTHHNRTVILVTHSLHLLPNSNHVTFNFSISSYLMQRIVFILMDSNQIIMSGNKTDLEHYKNRLLKPEESLKKEFGKRTASERWQLLKLISKVGFQRRRRTESQRMFRSSSNIGSLQFIPFRKRLETFSGSRYFAHDLLLPTDECNQDDKMDWNEFNKWCNFMTKSIHRKIVSRCTSLQADQFNQFSLTIRQSSSPSIQPISARTGLSRHGSTSEHGSLRRKLFAKSSNFNHQSQLEKVLSVEKRNQTLLQRVPSIVSEWSEDFNEDDEFLNGDFCQWGIDPIFEQRTYGNIPWKVYLTYLRECGLMISILFLSVTIFWQSLKVYSDFWLSFYSENTSNQAWIYLCVYAFHSTGCVFLSLASIGLGQYGGALARKELHNQLLFSLMHSRLQFFDITPLGRIINRFSNDISVVDKKIATSMQRLLQFLLLCFSAIIVNCIVSPWFLVAAVPLCVLYYLIQDFYRHSSRELQRLESITRSPILSHLTETSQGIDTIRAFGQENYFFAAFFHKLNVYSNAFIIHNSANRWLGIVLDYLGAVIVFVAITLSLITASLFPSIISPSLVGLAINYTLLVPIYLNWVVKFLADMETHMTAVERISEFISTESENYCPDAEIPQTWPSKGDIKFENVTVCYDKTKSPAVKSLNLHIFAGQKVGICGRSGSGKTSLIMSLFRIANLTKGTIFIDNVDIYNVPLQKLRSSLAVISQDVIMFSGSIRENLDLYHKYSDEELWKALEMAQLAETVKNLPHNLDGCVKEGGSNFSVGQRQLFCLARSILQNSVCLVMDEATSSLDPGVESELIFAAEKAFIGKTILSVTHRLSSILSYDRIIVLDSGKIVEDGSPSQLLSRPSGYFSLMLRASNETAFSEFEGLP